MGQLRTPSKDNLVKLFTEYFYDSSSYFARPMHLVREFRDAYALAKQSTPESLRKLLELALQTPVPQIEDREVLGHLKKALHVMSPFSPEAACTLLAVLSSPEEFPNVDEIPQRYDSKCRPFIESKIAEPVLREYQQKTSDPQKIERSADSALIPLEPGAAPKRAAPHKLELSANLASFPVETPFPIDLARWIEKEPIQPAPSVPLGIANPKIRGAVGKKIEDLENRVQTYQPSPSFLYQVSDWDEWNRAQKSLMETYERAFSEWKDLEVSLLKIANALPKKRSESAPLTASFASGDRKALTMEDVLHLFFQRDFALLEKRNPGLTKEDAQNLYRKTLAWLLKSIQIQQMKRVHSAMQDASNALRSRASETEISQLIEGALTEAQAKTHYSVQEHPEYLVFEHFMNIKLRQEQVEVLERLAQGTGSAREMIMGSGKTTVLLPLIAVNEADGEHLSCLILPEYLIPSMSAMLQERLGRSFSRMIEVVEIDRKTPLSGVNLTAFLLRLQSAVKDRKALIMSSSTLQSLFLRFIESLTREYRPRDLDSFREIFQLFRNAGRLVLDEIDTVLDVLKSHQYTLGSLRSPKRETVSAVSGLYELLATDPFLTPYFSFVPGEGKAPLTKSAYGQVVLPRLIEQILAGRVGTDLPPIKSYFSSLREEERTALARYLQGDPAAYGSVEKIPSLEVKNLLAVLKEELSGLLMLTASKEAFEHYGPVPQSDPSVKAPVKCSERSSSGSSLLAIPYHGNNRPAIGSQFGTELENHNFAVQLHLSQGIPIHLIEEEIQEIRGLVMSEIKQKVKRKSLKDCPSYRLFERLAGEDSQFQLFDLPQTKMKALQKKINESPKLKLHFIKKRVLPEIKIYASTLHGSTTLFPLIFPNVNGFSGTLWNSESFPLAFTEIHLSKTEERTLSRLLVGSPSKAAVLQTQGSDVEALVNELYRDHRGSFADLGGLFRGVENQKVAEKMLTTLPRDKKGVVFYDEEDRLMVLVAGMRDPLPIETCGLKKEQLIAYWDQKHTTGSDIPLSFDMKAVVSVGAHTIMRDLLQAVWRLRGLEKGQRVSFSISEKDRKLMAETLSQITGKEASSIGLKEIFLYVKATEALRQAKNAARALRPQLENLVLEPLFRHLFESTAHIDWLIVRNVLARYFVSDHPENPFDTIGSISQTIPKQQYADLQIKRMDEALDEIELFFPNLFDASSLRKEIRKTASAALSRLPDQLEVRSLYETEVEAETQKELKEEKQTEKETETEIERDIRTESELFDSRDFVHWQEKDLFSFDPFERPSSHSFWSSADPEKLPPITPLVNVKETLEKQGKMPPDSIPFSDALLASLNFMPVHPPIRKYLPMEDGVTYVDENGRFGVPRIHQDIYTPFGSRQDTASELLIVQDKKTRKIKAVLLTQSDALELEEMLKKDRTEQKSREVHLALYHLGLGHLYAQGSERLDEKALLQDPQFKLLTVQAKFFNGEFFYNETEIETLRSWFVEAGVQKTWALFTEKIREIQSHRLFAETPLGKLFLEMGISHAEFGLPKTSTVPLDIA